MENELIQLEKVANQFRYFYLMLVRNGFTKKQAMELVKATVRNGNNGNV